MNYTFHEGMDLVDELLLYRNDSEALASGITSLVEKYLDSNRPDLIYKHLITNENIDTLKQASLPNQFWLDTWKKIYASSANNRDGFIFGTEFSDTMWIFPGIVTTLMLCENPTLNDVIDIYIDGVISSAIYSEDHIKYVNVAFNLNHLSKLVNSNDWYMINKVFSENVNNQLESYVTHASASINKELDLSISLQSNKGDLIDIPIGHASDFPAVIADTNILKDVNINKRWRKTISLIRQMVPQQFLMSTDSAKEIAEKMLILGEYSSYAALQAQEYAPNLQATFMHILSITGIQLDDYNSFVAQIPKEETLSPLDSLFWYLKKLATSALVFNSSNDINSFMAMSDEGIELALTSIGVNDTPGSYRILINEFRSRVDEIRNIDKLQLYTVNDLHTAKVRVGRRLTVNLFSHEDAYLEIRELLQQLSNTGHDSVRILNSYVGNENMEVESILILSESILERLNSDSFEHGIIQEIANKCQEQVNIKGKFIPKTKDGLPVLRNIAFISGTLLAKVASDSVAGACWGFQPQKNVDYPLILDQDASGSFRVVGAWVEIDEINDKQLKTGVTVVRGINPIMNWITRHNPFDLLKEIFLFTSISKGSNQKILVSIDESSGAACSNRPPITSALQHAKRDAMSSYISQHPDRSVNKSTTFNNYELGDKYKVYEVLITES